MIISHRRWTTTFCFRQKKIHFNIFLFQQIILYAITPKTGGRLILFNLKIILCSNLLTVFYHALYSKIHLSYIFLRCRSVFSIVNKMADFGSSYLFSKPHCEIGGTHEYLVSERIEFSGYIILFTSLSRTLRLQTIQRCCSFS